MDTRQPRQQGVSELRGAQSARPEAGTPRLGNTPRSWAPACRPQGLPEGPDTRGRSQIGAGRTSPASRVEDGFEEDQMGSRGTN